MQTIYLLFFQDLKNFYHSSAFVFIKFILAIYVLVLAVDIILLLIQRGVAGNIRQLVAGINMPSELTTRKSKLKIRWNKILRRLTSANESEYKVAVIEADNIIDDLIKRLGYKGENLGERLANIPAGQLDNLDEIKEAHEIRNRIIHEEDFSVSREKAREVIVKYEHFLRHFEVLD